MKLIVSSLESMSHRQIYVTLLECICAKYFFHLDFYASANSL